MTGRLTDHQARAVARAEWAEAASAAAPPQKPAWQEINDLFARHGLPAPPTRLRDELVCHLLAFRLMDRP